MVIAFFWDRIVKNKNGQLRTDRQIIKQTNTLLEAALDKVCIIYVYIRSKSGACCRSKPPDVTGEVSFVN